MASSKELGLSSTPVCERAPISLDEENDRNSSAFKSPSSSIKNAQEIKLRSSLSPMQSSSPSVESTVKYSSFPTAFPGILNTNNDDAVDWGWQFCLAYGCQNLVMVFDARSMSKIQVLDHHKYVVSQVKWARENYYHSPRNSYSLRLASADVHGQIIVWDVCKGTPQSKFSDSEGPICDMAWHWHQDACHDMLLVLHPNSNFILWNAQTGTVIWKKSYSQADQLDSFDLDPHFPNRVVFISSSGLWMQDDLSLFKSSSRDLTKIFWDTNSGRDEPYSTSHLLLKDTSSLPSAVRKRAARFLARSPTAINGINLDDSNLILEAHFHRSLHDILIVVQARQILFISLRYSTIYRTLTIEKSAPPLLSAIPLRQLDAFYCLHVNGCISFRYSSESRQQRHSATATFHVVHQPEIARLIKQCKIQGFVMEPIRESKVAVILSDGRIFTWTLDQDSLSAVGLFPAKFLQPPRFILANVTAPLHAPPSVLEAGPLSQLLAVGSSRGAVQIFCLHTSEMINEFFVVNSPIQGVEWINEHEILVYAHAHVTLPSALIRSEILVLDLVTGDIRLIRRSSTEESPIRIVKISASRHYFVIIFKNGPPEVWSIAEGRPLIWHRPRSIPQATTAEWITVVIAAEPVEGGNLRKDKRELLLFVADNGLFQPYLTRGNVLQEDKSSLFTTQTTIGHVTTMCRKRNKIIMGDVDGSLIKWTPSESSAESRNLNRGWIRSIKFSPKERVMWAAVLFSDGLDVWELETMELINQLSPKLFKITALDWVSATHIALSCTDGLTRVYDCRNLQFCSSVLNKDTIQGEVFNPYLVSSESALRYKSSILLGLNGFQDLSLNDTRILSWSKISPELVSAGDSTSLTLSTVDRAIIAALFTGDENDYEFWSACLRGLPCLKSRLVGMLCHCSCGFLLTKEESKERFLDVANTILLHNHRTKHSSFRCCIRDLVLAGQSESATEFLLNSLEPTDAHYYSDCLKTALLAALCNQSSESVQSTVKMVATNLIANTSMDNSGIELLCMIGKNVDACRYLFSNGNYSDAVTLARISLDSSEAKEIILKWIDYLGSSEVNQKSFALLIAVHSGYLDRTLELMATSRQFERAALFLRACEEDGVLVDLLEQNAGICEAMFLEYARYLQGIGLVKEALLYCDKGGKNGQLLRQEFEILSHDI